MSESKGEHVMSKVRAIRESIDKKLDHWEATATAIEAQLQLSKEQAIEELEVRKNGLNETLEEFRSEIVKAKGLADEQKTEIQARFDELQLQLALGKAEARDSFEAQREKIQHSIATLEATVDRELDAAGQAGHEALRKAANEFITAAVRLEAEMEFMAIQFDVKKDDVRGRFEHERTALAEQIQRYKQQIEEKKQMARDKAATFENELSNGMSQIKQAFKKLFV
jgi:hypothetical protein